VSHCLIVVSRNRPEVLQELQQRHIHLDGVEVILDRRQQQIPVEGGIDRRAPPRVETDLRRQAFVVITRP
jgi:hypothetical protein